MDRLRPGDWTLITIASADRASLSPVQLQKALFLLGKELPGEVGDDFYEFVPYHYGPFSSAVSADAITLQRDDLVEIERPIGQRYVEYRVTTKGVAAAADLRARASVKAVEYLDQVVKWARTRSFAELVRAVYAKYPDMQVNSVFAKPG
ncbi:MAG: hypothetical protein EPO26_03050 [Chloroflexota bacterium]|nr:MAG: hypothetical protein EPO26_03050 [Chloroflexota bacterium]